jgi:hypothetical protein
MVPTRTNVGEGWRRGRQKQQLILYTGGSSIHSRSRIPGGSIATMVPREQGRERRGASAAAVPPSPKRATPLFHEKTEPILARGHHRGTKKW